MALAAVKQEVVQLSPRDFAAFRDWFATHDAERDVGAGRNVERDAALFTDLVQEHVLRPLASYGFAQHQANFLDPGMWVTLRNRTTELQIYFEYGSGPSVAIHQLDPATATHTGQNFGLDDLLWIRAPGQLRRNRRPTDFHVELLQPYLAHQGAVLRTYAGDVLHGDFTIYQLVDAVQAERERWRDRSDDRET